MIVAVILGLLLAGFLVGFLSLYIVRKQMGKAHEAGGVPPVQNEGKKACLWCGQAGYTARDPSFTCPKCGSVYHQRCWKQNGGCSLFECQMSASEAVPGA